MATILILRRIENLLKLPFGFFVKYRNSSDEPFTYAIVYHIFRFLRVEGGRKVLEEESRWGKRSRIDDKLEPSVLLRNALPGRTINITEAYLQKHPEFELRTLRDEELLEARKKMFYEPPECMSHY
jgi:hypothetical protein